MNVTTIQIKREHVQAVMRLLKANKVKHEPFTQEGDGTYAVTLVDSPFTSFIQLRFC